MNDNVKYKFEAILTDFFENYTMHVCNIRKECFYIFRIIYPIIFFKKIMLVHCCIIKSLVMVVGCGDKALHRLG